MGKRSKSINFGEAVRATSAPVFSAMVKPVGSSCNLDCHYCYYLDKASMYGGRQPVMDEALLEEYIRQYITANAAPEVTFCWHGGEPLLAGLDFYRRAIVLQEKYRGDKTTANTIQTNGTLIDKEWARFFARHGFLVGVSIDGPQDIHDAFRADKGGGPTFAGVMEGVGLLAGAGAEYNTLTTVNAMSERRGAEVYRFLKSIGSRFMQFLPVVEYVKEGPGGRPYIVPPRTEGSALAPWSVSAEGYGRFMNDVFDQWVVADVGSYYVQLFDAALAGWVGVPAALCTFAETCGDALAVEHNGDVFSCDHFVYPQYRLGNIRQESLSSMVRSREQLRFGLDKRNSLPDHCLRCRWHFVCRGECPKHRFDTTPGGEAGLNALCAGYRAFFSHTEPYMRFMAEQLSRGMPAALVMQFARQRMGLM